MSLNPKEFLNTAEELHALVIGLCEVLCPWPATWLTPSKERLNELLSEYHYYALGRGLGILTWLGIAAAVKAMFF